jgi:competence protein ComEA
MYRGMGRNELRMILAALAGFTLAFMVFEGSKSQAVPRADRNRIERIEPGRLTATPRPTPVALDATPPPRQAALPSPAPTPLIVPSPTPSLAMRLDGRLDLNRATHEDLLTLPGIGETRAQAILADRERLGPFPSVAALDRVEGFGEKAVERLAPLLWVYEDPDAPAPAGSAAASVAPVRINVARAEELETLAGIGPVLANRIIAFRAANGPFRGPTDLMTVPGIGPALIERNAGRLRYD